MVVPHYTSQSLSASSILSSWYWQNTHTHTLSKGLISLMEVKFFEGDGKLCAMDTYDRKPCLNDFGTWKGLINICNRTPKCNACPYWSKKSYQSQDALEPVLPTILGRRRQEMSRNTFGISAGKPRGEGGDRLSLF